MKANKEEHSKNKARKKKYQMALSENKCEKMKIHQNHNDASSEIHDKIQC